MSNKIVYGVQDSLEVAAAKVAKLRATGKLPPAGVPRGPATISRNPNEVTVAATNSGIGDCIQTEFATYGVAFSPSCSCTALRNSINRLTPEQAREQIDALVEKIRPNIQHATGVKGTLLKAFNWAAPDIVAEQIRGIVEQCASRETA